jgi:ABC-2 type transport system permease protein
MTAALPIPARPTLSQRITRALGKLFAPFGVDPDQYHALLQSSVAMDFRSHGPLQRSGSSSETKNALKSAVALNVLFSSILAIVISFTASSFFYSVITLGYSMVMLAMLILMEFALVVISPEDFPILAHRPISSRTFMAVRFSNLMFYILILGLSLNIGPALLGLVCDDARDYFPLVYLAVAQLANIFVAAAVVAVYGLLMRFLNYERLKDIIAYCQILFAFVFFLGYQLIPRLLLSQNGAHVHSFSHNWAVFLPPTWFANMIQLAQGYWITPSIISASVGLVVLLLVLPLIFRAISLDYSDRLGRMITASSKKSSTHSHNHRSSSLLSLFIRDPQERAFFGFLAVMFRRNRRFKMQLFPQYGSIFALLVITALDLDNRSQINAASASLTTMAFSLGAAAVVALLPFSDEFAGAWIFQIAPIVDQASILRAIKKAAALFIFIPLVIFYFIFFQFFMTRRVTFELGAYGFLSGWLLFQIALFRFRDFPFTRKGEKAVPAKNYAFFMFIFPLMVVAFLFPIVFSQRPVVISTVLLLMAALNLILGRMNNRRFSKLKILPE